MQKTELAIFTVCSISYLPKALVLAESVYETDKIKTHIYIIDKKNELVKEESYATITWIVDENIPNFNKLAFIYDITEFSTSIKPLLALRLLESHNKIIFLDPDICVYSSISGIVDELDKFPILLTPHYMTPIDSKEDDYDLAMMRFGSFNLGFFAVSSALEARKFLDWWSERCLNLGFFESQFGLSVDQKWVSIAPCFFENLKVLFNPGYNMAFWNLHERKLSIRDKDYFVNNANRLVFFHFSSFNRQKPSSISSRKHKWIDTGREDLELICNNYSQRLENKDLGYSAIKYGFDYMDNGWYISPTLRRAYAAVENKIQIKNPFCAKGYMRDFVKKNHLRQIGNKPFKPEGVKDIQSHSSTFKIINMGLRAVLFLIGPNSFSNISRLFVYLSSFRNNRDLWKLPRAR